MSEQEKTDQGAQSATAVEGAGSSDTPQRSHAAPTPGPWRISLAGSFIDGKPSAGVFLEAGDFHTLACLIAVEEVEANAHLISAAPELYEALKELLHASPASGWEQMNARNRAIAVIAKAEGRSVGSHGTPGAMEPASSAQSAAT